MTPLVLWSTQTFALMVAAHLLLLSTATDTQTDARRKPTRQQQQQQQHRKPTPSDVDDALPRLFPPPPSAPSSSSPSQQTTAASPNPPGGNRSSAGHPHQPLEPWGTGNVWTRNDGGRTTRRSSHGGGRKLRRNETTVEKTPFTVTLTPPPPTPPSSPSSSPSPPVLRSTERRVAPPSGIQDGGKNASKHASIAHGHHQKSVTARVELSPRQKTSTESPSPPPTPPPPSPPSLPGVVGVGREGGAVPCREACDTSLCPQVAAEACRGRVVKDDCQCCPVCTAQPPTTTTNQSKGDFFGPQQKPPSNACDGMVCEKNKVCILNIQGIPMCRCRNIYICRSAERRPICTVNGTFKNKCFVQVEECTTGKRIRVVHRGACRARSPVRQVKPYL